MLLAQTASALFLFWMVFPIFLQLITHVGERQDLPVDDQIAVAVSAALLHCLHWTRLKRVSMIRPRRNIILYHLCSFASRISFFFGGALFSAVFFRHLPELDVFPPLGQAMAKALYVVAVLFGLFCFSLELERLGKAFE